MWNLISAFEIVRQLEPKLAEVGFHCAIGGSVIYKGESEKDLDLLIYPHKSNRKFPIDDSLVKQVIQDFFDGCELNSYRPNDNYEEFEGKEIFTIFTKTRKRIDFFFVI